MTARDDNTARPTALGRGLDTLMGDRDAQSDDRAGQPSSTGKADHPDRTEAAHQDAEGNRPSQPPVPCKEDRGARPPESGIAVVSGLIAGGAAGAVAIAAFALLGVRAVLSMQRRNRLF